MTVGPEAKVAATFGREVRCAVVTLSSALSILLKLQVPDGWYSSGLMAKL